MSDLDEDTLLVCGMQWGTCRGSSRVWRVLSAVNVSEGPNSELAAGPIRSHKLIHLVHLLAVPCHVTTFYQLVLLPL
jgi:hypothetical protein